MSFKPVLMFFLLALAFFSPRVVEGRVRSYPSLSANSTDSSNCLTESVVDKSVATFSARVDYAKLERARELLYDNAKRSPKCRAQVINAFMRAMDKPNIDPLRHFDLWRYGATMLGELKAIQAIDLLIKHLNLNDGTSISVTHYPAMEGVIKMGGIAIPKLAAALKSSSDRNYRLNATFCIAQIGGTGAVDALKEASSTEADPCVVNFIRISINALDNKESPRQITLQDRARWYAAFSCN